MSRTPSPSSSDGDGDTNPSSLEYLEKCDFFGCGIVM